ncbi:MAG: hypothetical protein Q4D81_15170 [Eubacteriales bacterium]|nr:hypothetical protein [Eubacteriales bacterium]
MRIFTWLHQKSGKNLLPAAIAAVLVISLAIPASASDSKTELLQPKDSYNVSFTADKKMVSDFKSSEMYNQMAGMQPGDHINIVMNLKNENESTVDWYMTNKVLKSLEDTRKNHPNLSGGAYSYILTYKNLSTNDEKVLYSSDTVGGEGASTAGQGLHEATNALKDWFYLDTFSKGQSGVLNLYVELDGETQGNDYQDTLAELQMNFAVELKESGGGGGGSSGGGEALKDESRSEEKDKEKDKDKDKDDKKSSGGSKSGSGSSSGNKVVKTGDSTSTIPYLIATGVSGVVLLILAICGLRERRRQKGGQV